MKDFIVVLIMLNAYVISAHDLHPDAAYGPLQGGDNIATAFLLTGSLPITTNGTTEGYTDDYNEICPYNIDDTGPDVVYQYTPAELQIVDIDLCQSSFDTKLYIYENSYSPGNPYACNDDYYYDSEGPCQMFASKIEDLYLTAGNTYYIVIDGYNSISYGAYVMTISNDALTLPLCESFISNEWPFRWTEQLEGLMTTAHWEMAYSDEAGGNYCEAVANYYPDEGETDEDNDRMVSPPLNTDGLSSIHVAFHHMFDDYEADINDVWIKVQSSSDRLNWTDEWVYDGGLGNNIPAEVKEIEITNNLGNVTWIAWTLSGYTYDIDAWYVDDICISLLCESNTWTGTKNTDWNDAGNWTCGVTPDENIPVVIPASPSGGNFPVITSGIIAECYYITVELPGTLTIQNGGYLIVKED